MDFSNSIGLMVANYHKYCDSVNEPVSLGKYMLGNF